jgi:hypothetical protein
MTEPETIREFGTSHAPEPPVELAALDPYVEEVDELEQLRRELGTAVELPVITLPVETRPGYAVRYRTDVSQQQLDEWRKRAKDKRRMDNIAGERFASLIVSGTCSAIVRAGKEVTDDDEPMTFRSPALLDLLGARSAAEAAAKFYGADAYLDQAARAILREAGWGDEAVGAAEDPTLDGRR